MHFRNPKVFSMNEIQRKCVVISMPNSKEKNL